MTVILRGGRATLAAVVQLYKILALNSLITAFGLSVLTLDGVKLGDASVLPPPNTHCYGSNVS